MIIARLLLLLALSTALSHAQGFDHDLRVSDGPAGARQLDPQIRVAPDGTLWSIWVDSREPQPQIYLASSTDRGESFSPGQRVTSATGLQSGYQNGPQLAIDHEGGIHLIWQQINEHDKVSIRYSRSTDRGLSFSKPMAVAADSGMHNPEFSTIGVDSIGGVYIAWIDSREFDNGTSRNSQLYLTISRDRGLSFATPTRVTYLPRGEGGTCECCNTSIALSPSGDIHISFRSNIANQRDIHIARSLDGGATFAIIRAAGETWRINACPLTGSSIAVDREGTAHVVWRDSRPSAAGKDYIYYTTLRREDTLCAPDRRISSSPTKSNYPSLGIFDDYLLVAFQDTRNDASDIYYVESTDGGRTFSPDRKLTHESGTTRQEGASVAIAPDGTRYVAWQDARNGNPDIMMSRAPAVVLSAPSIAADPDFYLGAFFPHPLHRHERGSVRFSLPSSGPVRLVLHDITGRAVRVLFDRDAVAGEQEMELDLAGIDAGFYYVVLEHKGERVTRPIVVE